MPVIRIDNVRLSYCNLFQAKPPFNNPNGAPRFSVTILVPKTNLEAKAAIDQAVAQAIDEGVSACWGGIRPPQPAICIHDGDGPRPSDGMPYGDECKGCWVFTASSKEDYPPQVVDRQVKTIIDPTQVYSGMWANVHVSFYAYNNSGKKGIGCGLNAVQKVRDDDPLTGRVNAKDVFSALPQETAAPNPASAWPTAPNPGAAGSSWF